MDCKDSSYASGTQESPCGSLSVDLPDAGPLQMKYPLSRAECEKKAHHHENIQNDPRAYADDKPYSCSKCERSFTQKEHLIFHSRIHEGYRHYSCTECEKNFSEKTRPLKPLKTHVGNN